jgi:hypothetical protein
MPIIPGSFMPISDTISRALQLPGFAPRLSDDRTLEIEVSKSQSLNEIFASLSAQRIDVLSMRSKVSRLEELFVRLVGRSASEGESSRGEQQS